MRMGNLLSAVWLDGAMAANPMSLSGVFDMPQSRGATRRLRSYPRSKYMPHGGAKEQAKHIARRAAGIIECPHEEAPAMAMAA